ncbi:MAG: VacB/RNase II family 3'-5' exoribonuclease [Bacilli bacterium]|nr:VacB/RNase II family 3'-5' exoribonuclease [Bacilli bacterium]
MANSEELKRNEARKLLIELFNTPGKIGKKYKFKEIRKNICGKYGYRASLVREILYDLQLDGIVYYSEYKDLYMAFTPELNKVQGNITINKHGEGFIENGKLRYKVPTKDLNNALDGDLVVLSIKDKKDNGYQVAKVEKIVKRKDGFLVVEVCSKNGEMYLKPYNAFIDLPLVMNGVSMKPLVEGDRIQVKLSSKIDKAYSVGFVKYLGHKDDPDADIKMIAIDNNITIDFSEEAMEEARKLPTKVSREELKDRVDLRDMVIFSIDGKDTKDRDDAISIKKCDNGDYLLGVHISDVSHYIKPGMQLWDEAMMRGNSVYLLDRVIPMLPHIISNGICSLNPNVDRLTFSCFMRINKDGKVLEYDFKQSVIKSSIAMTYEDVDRILEDGETIPEYEPYMEELKTLQELSEVLEKAKIKRGYVDFGCSEISVSMDDDGEIKDITPRKNTVSRKMIENSMLVTGECSACFTQAYPAPFRVHAEPDEDRVEEAFDLIKRSGIRVKTTHEILNGKVIQSILSQINKLEDRTIAANILLRSMKRACYAPSSTGHFALALSNYSHFTSPIRRAADLMLHYRIKQIQNNEYNLNQYEEDNISMKELCQHISRKERSAENAEREAEQLAMIKYIENHMGDKFLAKVTYVNSRGIYIKTMNGIDGKIVPGDLEGDDFFYDDKSVSFKGRKSKAKISIGTGIIVTPFDTKAEYKTINFGVVEEDILMLKKKI